MHWWLSQWYEFRKDPSSEYISKNKKDARDLRDLSEIQVAVNNAFDLKNKELKKKDEEVKSAVGEKEELLKDL